MMGFRSATWAFLGFTLVALATIILFAATPVSAQRSFECQQVWDSPSSDNDIGKCLSSSSRIGSQWKYYVYPGVCALTFLFTLIGLPIIYCCHCCCCIRCCTSCTTSKNPARARCWLWMWIGIALVWAFCVCVLLIYGVVLATNTFDNTLDDVRAGPLVYFNDTKNEIKALLIGNSVDEGTAVDIDLSAFDQVVNKVDDILVSAKDNSAKYLNAARIVAICVGFAGVVAMLLIVIFPCLKCSGCCPVCFSFLYWVLAIVYSLLAVVFTLLIYFSGALCGEVALQYKREPGLMQWYFVPSCENTFTFNDTRDQVNMALLDACAASCNELLNYCDLDDAYPGSNADKIFICGNNLASASECTSLEFVSDVVVSSYVKPILSNMLCVNTTGWVYQERCTPLECQNRCEDFETPDIKARTWSREIIAAAGYAMNASTALSYVMPMMDCNFIVDRVISAVETAADSDGFALRKTGDVSNCSNLYAGFVMVGTGFFVGSLMFLLGIYILHAGSWMWGDIGFRDGNGDYSDNKGEDNQEPKNIGGNPLTDNSVSR